MKDEISESKIYVLSAGILILVIDIILLICGKDLKSIILLDALIVILSLVYWVLENTIMFRIIANRIDEVAVEGKNYKNSTESESFYSTTLKEMVTSNRKDRKKRRIYR